MNWLDILLIVVLGLSTFVGLKTGLIKVIATLAGLIIGVVLAGQYYDSLADLFSSAVPTPSWAKIVAFAIIFLLVLALAVWVASLLRKVASLLLLGWVDRLIGALLGLVAAGFICAAFLSALASFPLGGVQEIISKSGVAQLLLDYFPLVRGLLPEEFDTLRQFFQ